MEGSLSQLDLGYDVKYDTPSKAPAVQADFSVQDLDGSLDNMTIDHFEAAASHDDVF